MAYGFNNDKSKYTLPDSGISGRLVVFTDSIPLARGQYEVRSYNAARFLEIFETSDASKVHILSLDMKINIGTSAEPKYSWTTQPVYAADKWYSFPRYDLYDPALSDRVMDIAISNPLQIADSENVPVRLMAFVED